MFEMRLKRCYLVCLLSVLATPTLSVYTPSVTIPRKPHLTPGIKTSGWRNSPSEDVLIHHNYSHVNYQNPPAGNALTAAQIYESTTKKMYPVYKPDEGQNLPPPNVSRPSGNENHQKVIVRVKKQLQTYEKCPPGMTGQLVYSLSCNQFLNCWKGRTFIQNCAPGTLFNPDTLSCDFPEKVRCITGPRRTIYEEPSHTLYPRQLQPKCPEDFSGRIPNYGNCSKFIVCMQGKAMAQICPPGTLFDTNRNVCDFPKIAKCFNGENRDQSTPNVDYFVVGPSNHVAEQYRPSRPSYYQTNYGNEASNTRCGDNGCPKQFATHPPDGGDSGYLQKPPRIPANNCNPPSNCYASNPSQQQKPLFTETANPPAFGDQSNIASQPPPGMVRDPVTSKLWGCNLLTLECVDPPRYISNGGREGKITRPNKNVRIISNCNPQSANCGGQPNQNLQHVNPIQPSFGYNQGGYRVYSTPNIPPPTRKPTLYQPQAQCPPGATGVHPHPYNCSLFLNCANGQTFVMNCGPGTLFNEAMMTCDFDYNVDCNRKGVREPDGNDIRPYTTPRPTQSTTRTTEREDVFTTTYTYLTPDKSYIQRGHYITRPPKSQSFHRDSDYEDLGPSGHGFSTRKPLKPIQNFDQNLINDNKRETPKASTKTWPPPYPATDTNADYVFEYIVDMESDLGAQNANKREGNDCTKDTFSCGPSKCITKDLICNGIQDCPDARDEIGCNVYLDKFDVKKDTRLAVTEKERWDNTTATSCAYLCLESKNFSCKSFNYRKIDNCCLLSDKNEGMTGRLMAYPPNDYYELKSSKLDCSNMLKCDNNKCIQKSQICDGQDDCGDREDEKNCPAEKIGYNIRLNGGKNPWEGRIEISAFGRTGYVCDDKFDIRDANVVCKELGYHLGAAEVKGNSVFAKDVPPEKVFYMMDDVMCLGNETSIRDCDFNGWGSHDCTNTEVVGVVCNGLQDKCPDLFWKCKDTNECVPMAFVCDGPEDCSDGSDETEELCTAPVEVRLVNGTTRAEGRVEVKYHDVWGSVCDDDFNDDAAKVVCKSLGYKGTVTVKKDAYFGQGQGPIWLDQVTCFGNETKLEKCSHWKWGEHNCDHSEDVGVICSNSDTSDIERHVKNPQEINSSSYTTDQSYPIYPSTCGLRKNSIFSADSNVHFRVVQGSKAKVGDFPWQAAIRVKGQLRVAHWCGAVIISSKFVLTAAHCLVGYPKGAYIVVAGDYNVVENEGTEQHAYIEDFYIHEDFRKGHKMNNDIALVKLKGQGFMLNQDVQALCLPEGDTDYNVDLNCTISGFGSIESGVSAFSNELRAGEVPLLPETVCKMPHVYGDSLTDGMFCAGHLDGGTDACDGDSGGPLACLDNGLFTLYGITSWGHRCGYANKPGVYVKVAHYRKWIDDTMRKNV
ncbi:uncharacterized protein LOC123320918 [Coccinella septempunctata]|uniref:uncharacterized protein LOC123320918 n=1 Tax=Coccinella septempunctata TaxID=41139 RepID=UPI001D07BE00|nr:uncharacterized protein LOC123320918 [Coccinella septempunctata]